MNYIELVVTFKCIFRTVFYGEYGCSGPGANSTSRVSYAKQLSAEEANPFMDISFIDGKEWLSESKLVNTI